MMSPAWPEPGERRARREALRQAGANRPRPKQASRVRSALAGPLPRVGIATALGLATIVTPVLGLGSTGSAGSVNIAEATPAATVVPVKTVSRAASVLAAAPTTIKSDFRVIPQAAPVPAAAPASLAATPAKALTLEELTAIRAQAEQASRSQARAALPNCDGKPVVMDAANGRLNTDDLCETWSAGHFLRSDAATALARLNAEYAAAFGDDMCLTDAYRSYSAQVAVRSAKPRLAARPGTSQHGWGLAIDLCDAEAKSGTDRALWLVEHAPDFGWDNPDWARRGGSGPFEPWHWEFVAGQSGSERS